MSTVTHALSRIAAAATRVHNRIDAIKSYGFDNDVDNTMTEMCIKVWRVNEGVVVHKLHVEMHEGVVYDHKRHSSKLFRRLDKMVSHGGNGVLLQVNDGQVTYRIER